MKQYLKDFHYGDDLKTKYLFEEEMYTQLYFLAFLLSFLKVLFLIYFFPFFFLLLASSLPFAYSEIITLFDSCLLPW